jgi:hypothetical protein
LGGATSIYALYKTRYPIKGVILENTFSRLSDVVEHIFPGGNLVKYLLRNKWNTIDIIESVNAPFLFIKSL